MDILKENNAQTSNAGSNDSSMHSTSLDSTHNTPTKDSTSTSTLHSRLSDEDIAQLKKAQKRNAIIAIILGIILMTSGFFAGKAIKSHKNNAWTPQEICVVYHHDFRV